MDDEAMSQEPRLLITVDEAARRLSIARSTLYLHLQRGVLPSVRIGRCRRIALTDLENLVEQFRLDAANVHQKYGFGEGDMAWIDGMKTARGRR